MKYLILISTIFLVGCQQHPAGRVIFKKVVAGNVTVVAKSTSSGGALGSDYYTLEYNHPRASGVFFEGENPDKFAVQATDKGVTIVFCNGSVHRAQPIFIHAERDVFITVDVRLAC